MTPETLWKRFRGYRSEVSSLGLTLDVSRMGFEDGFIERMSPALASAFATSVPASC